MRHFRQESIPLKFRERLATLKPMDLLIDILAETWRLTCEMAPYLLIGFAFAGILSVLFPPEVIQKWMGRKGIGSIAKATLVGVPMPLCSCGVIPVAGSLRKQGASPGATSAFLTATPQTGVDSILATWSLLGLPFTLIRLMVSVVSGFVSGLLIELVGKPRPPEETGCADSSCCHSSGGNDAKSSQQADQDGTGAKTWRDKAEEAFAYGFVTLPRDVGTPLVIGLLVAGIISALVTKDLFGEAWAGGILEMVVVTASSTAMYVCATGSIPVAYGLLAAGFSPGAVLVFLVVGPATNVATISVFYSMMGLRSAIVYVTSLVLIAWLSAVGFNAFLPADLVEGGTHAHEAAGPKMVETASAIFLIGSIAIASFRKR